MTDQPDPMRLSWTDDGVQLVCELPTCRVPWPQGPLGYAHWTEDVPYGATPEDVVEQANHHRLERHDGPMPGQPDGGVLLARITIERRLVGSDDQVFYQAEDGDGDVPPLIEQLGMLTMSVDTAQRLSAGEVPEDDDE